MKVTKVTASVCPAFLFGVTYFPGRFSVPPEVPESYEDDSTYDGMTQKDIPRLLQSDLMPAMENYAKAAQEYRVILELQPNNPDASEGLRKIQVAQGRGQ